MRISTRGRYALRAMLDVAQHSGSGPVPRQEIAARQEISADYVAQLFKQLQAAGLRSSKESCPGRTCSSIKIPAHSASGWHWGSSGDW